MTEIPVEAESPSVSVRPGVLTAVDDVLVSWHPERGWLCTGFNHHIQPCEHTADLTVAEHPVWKQ